MLSDDVRVVLAVPTSWNWYFEPKKKGSIAWYAERVLAIADKFQPGRGLDVFLYGEAKESDASKRPHHEDAGTEVIRTRLERDSLSEWIGDWAVRPNMERGLFEDHVPASEVERRLGVGEAPWYGRPLPAVRAVGEWNAGYGGTTLVIFWLDRMTQAEEMARYIGRYDASRTFWQFFGDPDDVYYSFWSRQGMHQGKVLPQLGFHFGLRWSTRAVLRGFSRWEKSL
ncbi:hypothetical protein ACFWBB_22440 [Streptomyces sp. NPDC060000]|uniref:hypothetical protein n=1 Tax=Streptomyces sp. NPDC060000 TaxID=3347031 RepID=UPI0036928A3F